MIPHRGGSGIRTHGTGKTGPTVFKTAAFVRSTIPPEGIFAAKAPELNRSSAAGDGSSRVLERRLRAQGRQLLRKATNGEAEAVLWGLFFGEMLGGGDGI